MPLEGLIENDTANTIHDMIFGLTDKTVVVIAQGSSEELLTRRRVLSRKSLLSFDVVTVSSDDVSSLSSLSNLSPSSEKCSLTRFFQRFKFSLLLTSIPRLLFGLEVLIKLLPEDAKLEIQGDGGDELPEIFIGLPMLVCLPALLNSPDIGFCRKCCQHLRHSIFPIPAVQTGGPCRDFSTMLLWRNSLNIFSRKLPYLYCY